MDFGTFLREKEKMNRMPAGGGMDHFGAGSIHRFHGMEQGYRQRGPNIHHGYNDGGHNPGFTPRWNGPPRVGGPYGQQNNMPRYNGSNNRGGAGTFRNLAPHSREYSDSGLSRQSQHEVPSSQSADSTEKTGHGKKSGKGDDTPVKQDSKRVNQKQGPDAGNDQTQNSKGGNQGVASQSGTRDQLKHGDQHKQDKEMNPWKPFQKSGNVTGKKKAEAEEEAEDSEDEKEDEKAKAIKTLPAQHARGLMSTLIGLMGPEALNKKPDPLPPPRPMKLEDDNDKYLHPVKPTSKPAISNNAFLESGITAKMLEEANMEIDYDDRNLLPENIGREIARSEFYCKLCQKQMTSLGNFRDHLNGKSHKSSLDAVKSGRKLPTKGKKKGTKPLSELGQKSVCLDVVEGETEPILGLSFITEFHSITGIVCVCNLCAVKFDQNIVVSHTTGCKHRLRYMREKKPSIYVHLKKFGGKKSQLTTFLSDLCVGVEKEDGRGFPTIKVYNPEGFDEDDSLNQDEYENRRLINQAKRNANVDEKDLESVDFQDWVNREMRRSKEQYESQRRSPSPGFGDHGKSTESFRFGRQRSPSVMSDVSGRDYPTAAPMFPHPHPREMYMPPPLPPPPFPVNRQAPEIFNAYVGQGSLPPMTEQYVNPGHYNSNPMFYHAVGPGLDPNAHLNESRSHLSSNNEVSEKKSAILFDYGHGGKAAERDGIRTSRRSRSRDRDDISPSRKIAKRRADDRDDISPSRKIAIRRADDRDDVSTSRKLAKSRADDRDDISPSRKIAIRRADGRDDVSTSRKLAKSRADEFDARDVITFKQAARSRMDERDDVSTSRQKLKSRADERDEVSTSRHSARSREDRYDERESIDTSRHLARSRADERDDISNSRQSARSRAEERDEISTSREKARSRADERNVSTSVSRADKWEDDIQKIIGYSGKKSALDGLALLSRTYSSPEEESPSPPRKVKYPKELPFSKTYLEVESQKRQKDRRNSNELPSDLDARRNNVRKERFVEAQSKSRSPDVIRVRRRSPENYVVDNPQASHLTRRHALQRVDSPELVNSQKGRSLSQRSRSPVHVPRQQRRSRSPRDSSPPRSHKKPVSQAAIPSNDDTDAEAERIANLLLELSSSLSGQEDPQTALQKLFSNADLTRALLSSKSTAAGLQGKSSREKSSGEKMHSARSTEVGEPSGRHANVEQPSRYIESPDKSRRYAPNYTRSPEPTHSFARPESSRVHGSILKPATHSSRERVAFSVARFNRTQGSIPRASLGDFADDSDDS